MSQWLPALRPFLALILPDTVSFSFGAAVPIPTLPPFSIAIEVDPELFLMYCIPEVPAVQSLV